MAEFTIRTAGAKSIGSHTIHAENETEARRRAMKFGRILDVRKRSKFTGFLNLSMRPEERVVFLSRLAMMLKSRVGMTQALDTSRKTFGGNVSRVANKMHEMVEQGQDIKTVVSSFKKDIPQTTAALIGSGMKTGDIGQAFEDAAEFEREMLYVRRESSKGLFSAVFTFILSIATIIFTSEFVGPWVLESQLIEQAGDSVNVDWIYSVANVVSFIMFFIAGTVTVLSIIRYIVKPIAPTFADTIIRKVPVYRDIVLSKNSYITLHSLGILVDSGIRMENALKLTAENTARGVLKDDINQAHAAVKTGQPWAPAMSRSLDPTDIAALRTSQDRTQISRAIHEVAAQNRKLYSQRILEVIPGMQLLSGLFMAIAGGLIFGMVILPMLQMTQGIM